MAFDYDVVVIGSGFGGSVAALRAVETLRPPESFGVAAARVGVRE
jgi:succinate dehydrogenase/fumarate reductase flavoprotein subunit